MCVRLHLEETGFSYDWTPSKWLKAQTGQKAEKKLIFLSSETKTPFCFCPVISQFWVHWSLDLYHNPMAS